MYSEFEVKYILSTLMKLKTDVNKEDYEFREGKFVITKHQDKMFHTLEVLMNQLNMMFFWGRIQSEF